MKFLTKTAAIAALTVTVLGYGSVSFADQAIAQTSQATKSSALPDSIRKAVIGNRKGGAIAGQRIGNTNYFVVYHKSVYNCGSAGCKADIWHHVGKKYIRKGSLPVGHLPITVLPQTSNGMPWLGVSVDDNDLKPATLAVAFDGEGYNLMDWDTLLPENTGKVLISREMLKPY